MTLPVNHLLAQGPVIKALGRAVLKSIPNQRDAKKISLPGVAHLKTINAPNDNLVNEYIKRYCLKQNEYSNSVPPHFFPQWAIPICFEALEEISCSFLKVINLGCKMIIHEELPRHEKYHLTARLLDIEDDGYRAKLSEKFVTGTQNCPNALDVVIYFRVPSFLKKDKLGPKKKIKSVPKISMNAKKMMSWPLSKWAGLEYALLSGDINPIHWVPSYAKLFGHKSSILHGFASMSMAYEGMSRLGKISQFDVQFTRTLNLPANVNLYYCEEDHKVYIGQNHGEVPFLVGTVQWAQENKN